MVTDLVGAGRRDQGHQPLEELVGLHQDVRGSVAPARLQPKGETSVGPLFEAIGRERRPRHVVTQPLEAAPIAGGHGDLGVEADAVLRGNAA